MGLDKGEGSVADDLIFGAGGVAAVGQGEGGGLECVGVGVLEEGLDGDPAAGVLGGEGLVLEVLDGVGGEGVDLLGLGVGKVMAKVGADDEEGVGVGREEVEEEGDLVWVGLGEEDGDDGDGTEGLDEEGKEDFQAMLGSVGVVVGGDKGEGLELGDGGGVERDVAKGREESGSGGDGKVLKGNPMRGADEDDAVDVVFKGEELSEGDGCDGAAVDVAGMWGDDGFGWFARG